MKEESTEGAESTTRKQLKEKIASLPQSQLAQASDALAMIWDGLIGLSFPPVVEPKYPKPKYWKWNRTIHPLTSDSQRLKLALLRSIPTGSFIDVQFYAYNGVCNNQPVDPKPLFTSSIMIEEWVPAITKCESGTPSHSALTCNKEIVEIDSKAVSMAEGLTDDYESWPGGFLATLHKDKSDSYVPGL